MPAEQVDQAERVALLIEEAIILRHRSRRQRAALLGDALDLAAKRDLLGEQRGPRPAIIFAFADPTGRARLGHLARGLELVLGWQGSGVAHLSSPLVRWSDSANRFDADARLSYKKQLWSHKK